MRTIPVLIATLMTSPSIPSLPTITGPTELTYVKRLPQGDGPAPLLVLLHGYGSNERDLFELAHRIPAEWLVVSVRGPLTLGAGSHAWYPAGRQGDRIVIDQAVEAESRAAVLSLITQFVKQGSVDPRRIVVAGFSQGASLSENIALTHPDRVAGFAVFSGRYVQEIAPSVAARPALAHLKAFLSHGTGDHLLPSDLAAANRAQLQSLGIPVTYAEDITAHTISPAQFDAFVTWLTGFN
jgi:phospholipase/carboxylesterase